MGGGYQQHNPEYRAQSEDAMNSMFWGQLIQDNPQMMDYFKSNPQAAQYMADKLGLSSIDQLQTMNMGLTPTSSYQNLANDVSKIGYTPQTYDQVQYNPTATYKPAKFNDYQFNLQDITPIADQAYQQAQLGQEESAQRGFSKTLSQLQSQMGGRGFGPGGMANAEGTSLGRQALQGLSDSSRQMNYQQAQDKMELAKFNQQMQLNKQMQQSAEGRFGSQFREGQNQYGSQFKEGQNRYGAEFKSGQNQFSTNLGVQNQLNAANVAGNKAGLLGNVYSQQNQRGMMPYGAMSDYFTNTIGLTGPAKSKPWWQKGIDAVGTVAGAAGSFL